MKRNRASVHLATFRHGPTRLLLSAGEDHLIGIRFTAEEKEHTTDHPVLTEALRQLDGYFSGERREFDLPLRLEGSDFQRKVWEELLRIPYGETISYRQLSERIGNTGAIRAVGLANGRNPIAIVVPCHRVIGSDGKLTGYGGGLENKQMLLDLERGGMLF